MGCTNEKSAGIRFTLTDVQRKTIAEVASQHVLTSAILRSSVIHVAQRYSGEKTKENILNDTRAVAMYFKGHNDTLPKELGAGDRSVAEVFDGVKRAASDTCSEKLGPQIDVSHPEVRSDVELQKAVRHAIQQQSDIAVTQAALEQVNRVLGNLGTKSVPRSSARRDSVSTEAKDAPPIQHPPVVVAPPGPPVVVTPPIPQPPQPRIMTQPRAALSVPNSPSPQHAKLSLDAPQQHRGSGLSLSNISVSPTRPNEVADAPNLPKGDWIKAIGTPYYYSASENLYFHPSSCQFYDPSNGMWYDPDSDEWYHED